MTASVFDPADVHVTAHSPALDPTGVRVTLPTADPTGVHVT